MRQRAGSFQVVPTRPVNPALLPQTSYVSYTEATSSFLHRILLPLYIFHLNMFDKDRFHNALALSLGYERIVKDQKITIEMDDSDDPAVTLKLLGCPEVIQLKASEINEAVVSQAKPEIRIVMEAIQEAYEKARSSRF